MGNVHHRYGWACAERPDRHHIFPQEQREWFELQGFDIDRVTVELSPGEYSALHTMGWNQEIMAKLIKAEQDSGKQLNPRTIWKIGYGFMRSQNLRDLPFYLTGIKHHA